ncbi:MAG: bifunctional hydroxymethylpyrimidine kinase/phosphomethylpyrimidine kinase [Granulosicoccus sp.]
MTSNEKLLASEDSIRNPARGLQTPIALTIAGSDSGGGAGIQADLKTFSAQGVYGASVITAVTAQNTQAVSAVHDIPAPVIRAQLTAVLDDLDVTTIKIGMLSSVEVITTVSTVLREYTSIPIVLDPVMVAKSGDALLQPDAVQCLLEHLCPMATMITPNLPEAATLLQDSTATTLEQMQEQARRLASHTGKAVLVKGGHLAEAHSTDVLHLQDRFHHFESVRIDTGNTHGTGCTLSSAIAAQLALGKPIVDAVSAAEHYVHEAIKAADQLSVGRGHGPVHHFHQWWTKR